MDVLILGTGSKESLQILLIHMKCSIFCWIRTFMLTDVMILGTSRYSPSAKSRRLRKGDRERGLPWGKICDGAQMVQGYLLVEGYRSGGDRLDLQNAVHDEPRGTSLRGAYQENPRHDRCTQSPLSGDDPDSGDQNGLEHDLLLSLSLLFKYYGDGVD